MPYGRRTDLHALNCACFQRIAAVVPPARLCLRWFWPALLLLALWFYQTPTAAGQSQTSNYWQYPASARLNHLILADLNDDGVEEFLLADDNGKVDVLNADGVLEWSYTAQGPITAITAFNANGDEHLPQEVVLATENSLILLSNQGELIWQRRIRAMSAPIALLTSGSARQAEAWQSQFQAKPVALSPLDYDGDGREEILLLLASAQLQLIDANGKLIWQYTRNSAPLVDTQPHLAVSDIDGDGDNEIVLGFFNPRLRFSQLALINRKGHLVWDQEQSISGRLTAMTLVTFGSGLEQTIAVGTKRGQVNLYDKNRQRVWPRTVNKAVTGLAEIHLPDGRGLAVATEVGTIVAFNEEGRRIWVRNLAAPEADRSIVSVFASTYPPQENQPLLSVAIESEAEDTETFDIVMLGSNGRTLETISAVSQSQLSRLTDINHDTNGELVLTRAGSVELLGVGVGASEIAGDWEYSLAGTPSSYLVIDLDRDGADELLIGTDNGRLHRLDDGLFRWVIEPGNAITHLAGVDGLFNESPQIIVVRTDMEASPDEPGATSWLELRQANGERVWEQSLPTQIHALQVADVEETDGPEIVVGTAAGEVIVFSAAGDLLWEAAVHGSVEHLLVLPGNDNREPEIIAVTSNQIFQVNQGFTSWRVASFSQPIQALYYLGQSSANAPHILMALVEDGIMRGLTSRGTPLPNMARDLGGKPVKSVIIDESLESEGDVVRSFLVATETGLLMRLDIQNMRPTIAWQLTGMPSITGLHWGDLDGDALPDMATGNERGTVRLYSHDLQISAQLDLADGVAALSALHRADGQKSDLLAITSNGLVRLYRAQENWPPLLTNPQTDVAQGQYSIIVSVRDVETDPVDVRLEIQDPATGEWLAQETKRLTNGRDKLFWFVNNPPTGEQGVTYRYYFDDGFHQGYVTPPVGRLPIPAPPFANASPVGLGLLGAMVIATAVLLLRQTQSPTTHARRFYRQLLQQPTRVLTLLERKYKATLGSPDFLLHLAGQARQNDDQTIASLADGLFLLADRPHAGLPIITSTLDEQYRSARWWDDIQRWQMIFATSQALLEAPSITALSLLRPQLIQLLDILEGAGHASPALTPLLPILTNLRDSERVDLAEDSLVYLNEAANQLHQLQQTLSRSARTIENTLVSSIAARWLALVSAEIEDLRGRASLAITLKTKRLVPDKQTDVVLEIHNSGRAAAENVVAVLDENAAYVVIDPPQVIPFLPPGRARQISFCIEPKVSNDFRVSLTVTYNDRNRNNKAVAFGDLVHLLPPVRDFRPVANPYLPGTPLRNNSTLFFGREELFNFIAENIGQLAQQRNVLILIGQRRTGKTSALLRLDHHLPSHLLPVYIDCQSLGVIPGMPALLHDLAWSIADALASRGINVDVPDLAHWREDPTGCLERQFLPDARALLPEGTTMLLVFDEFETFENLVDDNILPQTLFTYLRHLMQHVEGLGFVFVGTRRLEEMSANYWSVLFNIALYRKIGYLDEKAATRLICEPVKPNLIYDDLALDKILRITTGHPYFLQLVCYTLVKRANLQHSGYVTISDVNAAVDEMLRLGEVHFAFLWQRSTFTERALLTAVAHLMDRDVPFHPADVMQYLEKYDIHFTPAEITAALGRLVERDILREVSGGTITLYELKIGLVGLWVAQHKSLSKLYASNGKQRRSGEAVAR